MRYTYIFFIIVNLLGLYIINISWRLSLEFFIIKKEYVLNHVFLKLEKKFARVNLYF